MMRKRNGTQKRETMRPGTEEYNYIMIEQTLAAHSTDSTNVSANIANQDKLEKVIKKVLIGLHIAKDIAEAIAAEAAINLLLQYSVSVSTVLTVGIICIVALRIVIRRINEYRATMLVLTAFIPAVEWLLYHIAWNVMIHISYMFPISSSTRVFISPAALLVKVTASMLYGPTPDSTR